MTEDINLLGHAVAGCVGCVGAMRAAGGVLGLRRFGKRILRVVLWLETGLALCVMVAVLVGVVDLVARIRVFAGTPYPAGYDEFRNLLGFALLLVIGLELTIMLVRHTPGSVIEVMLYATARKVLIYTTQTHEFLLGVVALAVLFAIRRYLFVPRIADEQGHVLSAATRVADVNRIAGVHIPERVADTLGGIVAALARERGEALLDRGRTYKIADAMLEIVEIEDGVVEKVQVTELD